MKRDELLKILVEASPKEKALLIIKDNTLDAEGRESLLTKEQRHKIKNSFNSEVEKAEFNKYLKIAMCYEDIRFNLVGLYENVQKLITAIRGYCYVWELGERFTEYVNIMLSKTEPTGEDTQKIVAAKKMFEEALIKNANNLTDNFSLTEVKGELRVDLDSSKVRGLINNVVEEYKVSFGIAKAFLTASDAFVKKYRATAFIPEDVKEMLDYLKHVEKRLPKKYRRAEYLKICEEKGANSIEAKMAGKYAVLPTFEEIEILGDATGSFKL